MTPAFGLSTIGQIALMVRDIGSAVEFYRDKLGLPFLLQTPKMAFFDCDGVRLVLGPEEADRRTYSSLIYFKVREIEAASAELQSRGVIFQRDPHLVARLPDYDLWMAFFRDPDGNALALMCEKPRPAL